MVMVMAVARGQGAPSFLKFQNVLRVIYETLPYNTKFIRKPFEIKLTTDILLHIENGSF